MSSPNVPLSYESYIDFFYKKCNVLEKRQYYAITGGIEVDPFGVFEGRRFLRNLAKKHKATIGEEKWPASSLLEIRSSSSALLEQEGITKNDFLPAKYSNLAEGFVISKIALKKFGDQPPFVDMLRAERRVWSSTTPVLEAPEYEKQEQYVAVVALVVPTVETSPDLVLLL